MYGAGRARQRNVKLTCGVHVSWTCKRRRRARLTPHTPAVESAYAGGRIMRAVSESQQGRLPAAARARPYATTKLPPLPRSGRAHDTAATAGPRRLAACRCRCRFVRAPACRHCHRSRWRARRARSAAARHPTYPPPALSHTLPTSYRWFCGARRGLVEGTHEQAPHITYSAPSYSNDVCGAQSAPSPCQICASRKATALLVL